MFLKIFLLISAHFASAAASNGSSVGPRTFAMVEPMEPDEPLDLREFGLFVDDDDGGGDFTAISPRCWRPHNGTSGVNGTSRAPKNVSGPVISEKTMLFLTGRVSTVFIPSVYTLVFLISVPLNALAVVTFARQIRPKKPAVIYMLNLACADLLFAMFLPFKISYHFRRNDWTFGPLTCRVVTAAFYCNMHGSVLLIAAISTDRLLAVVYPINSLVWRTPRNAVAACVAVWMLAFAGSVPLVLSEQTARVTDLGITTCHDVHKLDQLTVFYKIYFTTICCCLFFLPLIVTVGSYTRVIWSLSRVPHGAVGRSRRRARALVMALTVLVMFVLCFTPTNCLLLIHYLQLNRGAGLTVRDAPDGSYAAYLVFVCVGSLNCCLDPLLYYFGSSQCQRQLSSALRCQKIPPDIPSSSGSFQNSSRTILKSSITRPPSQKSPKWIPYNQVSAASPTKY
ncbi:hypothetical protein LDENG_00117910 [Lucifuga dentata]|nr:hypothetical protein LDENG_00117910 [Lucifuga dentata]